jgi:hypothetical protein
MAPKKKHPTALIPTKARALSAKEFLDLADVPPEIEWFANITNPQTRRAHQCERNAVVHNPVKGVKRSKASNNEGLTLALVTSKAACS